MLDLTFKVLSDKHRRRILTALLGNRPPDDGEVYVPEDLDDGERDLDDLQMELHHTHLPILETARLIRWNEDSQTVTRGPRFDDVRPLLDLLVDNSSKLPGEWA